MGLNYDLSNDYETIKQENEKLKTQNEVYQEEND